MNNSTGAGPIYNKNKLRKAIYISNQEAKPKRSTIKEKRVDRSVLMGGKRVCGEKGDNNTWTCHIPP
jgi:hypothetical protein